MTDFPNLPPHDAVTGTSQLLSLLHLSMLSLHHFRTPYLLCNLPFTRRTSGHCLGTFSRIFAYASPVLNTVSLTTIPALSLLSFIYAFIHSNHETVINTIPILTMKYANHKNYNFIAWSNICPVKVIRFLQLHVSMGFTSLIYRAFRVKKRLQTIGAVTSSGATHMKPNSRVWEGGGIRHCP
jgi:hypothetical protein